MLTRTFAVGKFLEKNSDDHAANCPEMIDQAFVVFGNDIQVLRRSSS